jgi:flagellar basal body-associated protein FliL
MRINNHNNHRTAKIVIVSIAAVLLVGSATVGAFMYFHRNDIKRNSNGISTEQTPQDKQLEQNLNNNPDQKQQTTQTDHPAAPSVDKATNFQQVNVILTNTGETNGSVSASGFVSNTVESTGTCKYVFTNGQKSVEKTSTTLTNSTSTTCKTVQFSASELSAGTWKVQLKYSSPTSTGLSNTLDLVVS